VTSWFEQLKLTDATLFVQDWGSLIGLRVAAEQGDRIARLVVANGFLPAGQGRASRAFAVWRAFARYSPVLPAGLLVAAGTVRRVPPKVRAGYDAPFPNKTYQAGARAFPQLVPTSHDDPATWANRAAWDTLGRWEKPFLAIFGARDPILGQADRPLIKHIPGAAGQPHARINASHFIQEDSGPELAERVLSWQKAVR
jgi:haloalkane dehalogenase